MADRYADLDFDPEEVPVRPAATIMLVDDRPDLQVLLLKRNARSIFVPDMWVFPGGAVDPGDAEDLEARCKPLTDATASEMLELPQSGLAFWVAAIRETFEESGLLLARKAGEDGILTLSDPESIARFEEHRRLLNASEVEFADIIVEEDLHLEVGDVFEIARWVTPLGSPRRYDARFFMTTPPEEQTHTIDDDEAVDSVWMSPQEALDQVAAGEMIMMTPTIRMTRCLARFGSAAEAMESAAARLSVERARVIFTGEGDQDYEVVLPFDDGYDTADETVENGWIRLRPS